MWFGAILDPFWYIFGGIDHHMMNTPNKVLQLEMSFMTETQRYFVLHLSKLPGSDFAATFYKLKFNVNLTTRNFPTFLSNDKLFHMTTLEDSETLKVNLSRQ